MSTNSNDEGNGNDGNGSGKHRPRVAAPQAVQALRARLRAVEIGEPLGNGRLIILPLSLPKMPAPGDGDSPQAMATELGQRKAEVELLCDAIAAQTAEVTELATGATVPQLAVRNRGKAPILIPEGEVLIGAKQNRVANVTVLVPPLHDF